MDSTPPARFCQNSSTFRAPGNRQDIPTIAISNSLSIGSGTFRSNRGFRQCLSVGLPVGGQRNLADLLEMAGYHILGEVALKMLFEGRRVDVLFANDVGNDEDDVLRILLRGDDAVSDPWVTLDRIFDFAQFDPQTADFDLVIFATQVLNIPVRQPARNIPGEVNSLPGHGGVFDKPFIRQFRIIQIASGQTYSGNAEFPGLPDRHQAPILDDVSPNILNRPADGNFIHAALRGTIKVSHIDGCLRGSIKIRQPGAGVSADNFVELPDVTGAQSLAAGENMAQRGE